MAIVATDLVFYLSGGAANSDPAASIGGAASSTLTLTGAAHDLFDAIAEDETDAGDVEYRCAYLTNTSAETATNARLWIEANTPSPGSSVEIGLGAAAINGTETAAADEGTAPAGVSFSAAPVDKDTALVIGDLPAGASKSIWIKRVVTPGMAATASDTMQLGVRVGSGA